MNALQAAERGSALTQRLLAFARRQAPAAFPSADDGDVAGLVRAACAGQGSFAALGDPAALVLSTLPPAAQRALHTTAPERVTLASGRSVPIHYDASDTPWIESRLQDFFGMARGPSIAGGRVPLTLHLLAPNGRAVQVRIIDRGPAAGPRAAGIVIDVSYGAAESLRFVRDGRTRVRLEVLRWGD